MLPEPGDARSTQALEWVMQESAVDLGAPAWDGQFGWGLPRMDAAIARAGSLVFFDGFETGTTDCARKDI
jgi:hypothetical protein